MPVNKPKPPKKPKPGTPKPGTPKSGLGKLVPNKGMDLAKKKALKQRGMMMEKSVSGLGAKMKKK